MTARQLQSCVSESMKKNYEKGLIMITTEYRIKDIGEVVGGGTPRTDTPEYWNGNIPWLSPVDLSNYSNIFISKGQNNITELGLKKSSAKLLPKDTVLLSSRAPIGYLAIAENEICTNQGFKSIICDKKKVVSLFLYYYLKLNIEQLKSFASGATFPELSGNTLKKIKIQLPPLPTQEKIASILSAYDNLIQNYKKQIDALQTAASELYKEWFVRFRFPGYQTARFENGIPEGWKVERIGNVGEVIGGGTPSTENEEYWDGDIPWLSPVDLSDNTNVYVSRGSKNITELGLKKSNAKMMPTGTVLLSSRAPVGYVALAKNPICTNQGFKSVVCNTSVIQPIYLYYYFRMNKNYLQSIASGATFPELSGSMMKKIKVLLPTEKVQQEFSKRARIFIEKAELLSEQITNLTQQRDLLLPRLMSGKLEVK